MAIPSNSDSVGLYFLYMLLFILAPLGYGVGLAVLLKEIHQRQVGRPKDGVEPRIGDIAGEAVGETEPTAVEGEPVEAEPSVDAPAVEAATETVAEPVPEESAPAEEATPEAESPQTEPEPESPKAEEPELHSVFDDMGLLPKSFKADEVIDEMLSEDRSETPDDLSTRIEQESEDDETPPDSYDEDDDNDFFDFEDDALSRAMEYADSGRENRIDFSDEASAAPDAISFTARELLGEDFDFSALEMSPADPNDAVKAAAEAPLRDLGDGAYQAETPLMTDDLSLLDAMPEEQDIVSAFPGEMVQNAVIEPDQSETARENSFFEDLRPMFVRRRPV